MLQFSWKCNGFGTKYCSALIVLAKIASAKVLIFVLALREIETSMIYAPQINLLLVFWSMCYAWSWIHFDPIQTFFCAHHAMAQVRGSSLVIMASWVEVWWAIHHGNSRGPLISAHQPSFETDHAVRQLWVAPGKTHQQVKLNYNNGNDSSHVVGNWYLNQCPQLRYFSNVTTYK